MNRSEALNLLQSKTTTPWLIKHCIAAEAVMRELAKKLNQDEDLWGITALLHDLDFDETKDTPEQHTKLTIEWLKESDLPQEALHAIGAHNAEYSGYERATQMDYALTAAETLTGLITSTALVMPDKKLSSVKPKSVIKRMKQKAFARNVCREDIQLCEKLGIPLDEFISIGLQAMNKVSEELEL